jgi:hypothetical protein
LDNVVEMIDSIDDSDSASQDNKDLVVKAAEVEKYLTSVSEMPTMGLEVVAEDKTDELAETDLAVVSPAATSAVSTVSSVSEPVVTEVKEVVDPVVPVTPEDKYGVKLQGNKPLPPGLGD